jgi:DNA-binding response OmpR family regulator
MLPQIEELATVVVCEDDDPTRELLCDHLTADRYRALPAPSASDALRLCSYNHPDLMVLDLGLPDAPGIDVLREIRGAGERFDPELPVVVLSGRTSEADRLRGFEAGADDYLPKPFHYPELLARVAAVLRRRTGQRSGPMQIGDLTVDPVTRRVRLGDREVRLANKEFAPNPLNLA